MHDIVVLEIKKTFLSNSKFFEEKEERSKKYEEESSFH